MKRNSLVNVACCVLFLFSLSGDLMAQKSPLTVAESSNFTATSRYADVISFIENIQSQTNLIRTETLCTSPEGREVPVMIIGNPPPTSPSDLNNDDRKVVYIQGNIHAGEVEGKEAILMLARDIIQGNTPNFLDKLVILFVPIFNSDGNEKISPNNRRGQDGPEKGMGVRYNGQNLDLNRDGMKLESPEMQGLVANILNRWDPFLLFDCHTTNGSYHEEPVTYSWMLNPNGDQDILAYMRDKMCPATQSILKTNYNTLSIPYGNFMDQREPEKGWRTFGHQPRYLTNYVGLRNRLSILIENYSHATFKTRVLGNYHYLLSILEYCHNHLDEIQTLVKNADLKTVKRGMKPTENDLFSVENDLEPMKEKVTILGYKVEIEEREGQRPRVRRTDEKKTYIAPYFVNFVPKRQVRIPYGYFITASVPEIAKKLKQHGITVEKLNKPVNLTVETFKVEEMKAAERLYQGHHMNTVKGTYAVEDKEFTKGTLFVRTAQPLGNLVSALLEPESDDGLLVWNFFDRYLVGQWGRGPGNFPVYKLYAPENLVTTTY